jgi:hypothetical protein
VNIETIPLVWRRSPRCDSVTCVEIAEHEGHIFLRNSTSPTGPILTFTRDEWEPFVEAVKDKDFVL